VSDQSPRDAVKAFVEACIQFVEAVAEAAREFFRLIAQAMAQVDSRTYLVVPVPAVRPLPASPGRAAMRGTALAHRLRRKLQREQVVYMTLRSGPLDWLPPNAERFQVNSLGLPPNNP
jgi:hypothetical protein